ncbi:ribulose-phosphate 3-epimerase [Candidatus Daviesbacteria bacterium]|nr:ribulose-phosphate 3-epimerase [Candidatus Daviesbacteria bacterium]
MVQIIPAVLPTTDRGYNNDFSRLEKTGLFEWVHIDFMDNKFVPNEGIRPSVTSKYKFTLKKEAHLMVQNPKEWIDELVKADFKRVLFHLESEDNQDECLSYAKAQGLETGLVLKHETPLEKLEPFISKTDIVMLMGVVPGFQGQPFIEGVVDKLKELKSKQWPIKAAVDGAVRDTNIKKLVDAGVDYVIVGSFLLKGEIDDNLEKLWEAVDGS